MLGVREDIQQTQEGVPILWQNKRSGRVYADVIEQKGGGRGMVVNTGLIQSLVGCVHEHVHLELERIGGTERNLLVQLGIAWERVHLQIGGWM